MIGKLRGIVDSVGTETAILDVGGVGYVIHAPATTLAALVPGEEATVHVETVLREDMLRLFGFVSAIEMQWFRLLQTVQGVGSKVALAILGTLTGGEIAAAVAVGDHKAFARASGVGPRLGQRIAAELAGRIPEGLAAGGDLAAKPGESQSVGEATSALENLGYGRAAALSAVRDAAAKQGADAPVAALIRHALKGLSAR